MRTPGKHDFNVVTNMGEDEMTSAFRFDVQRRILSGAFAVALSLFALPASAEPVVRIVSFTAAGPSQQKELEKIAPVKLYKAAKGCQWVKFWQDTTTLETGSVSLWDSRADMEAFAKSDAFQAVFSGKVKPLTKGDISVKVYSVVEPKQ
jgi:heme-degrading monooxygenase HmoA